jgi:hypothetical protein
MRWRAGELHRGKGCRGKQHEAKFCHDDLGPRGKPWQDEKSRSAEPVGVTINGQPLGRIVAGYKRKALFISFVQGVAYVAVHCAFRRRLQIEVHIVPCGRRDEEGSSAPRAWLCGNR